MGYGRSMALSRQRSVPLFLLLVVMLPCGRSRAMKLRECKQLCDTTISDACDGLKKGEFQRCRKRIWRQCKKERITASCWRSSSAHIEFLDDAIATCDRHIERLTAPQAAALARLDTIPGVARRTAETIVAELGDDMSRFPTAGHAASWAGLCPGNNESAGKRLSGRTRIANRTLRAALVESARGAIRTRDCYLAAQYRRLVKRRGDKKAIVAVANSILVIAYHVLRDGVAYRELGGDYFDHLNADRLTRYHTKRLAALGYLVTLTKRAA